MTSEKPSRGAEGQAAIRAAESMRPENERICYDPLAKYFLGFLRRFFVRTGYLYKQVERRLPGAIGSVVACTRYIDDYLEECIADRIEQLIVLGAGYDTRAYRFDKLKEKVKVFELDLPATLNVKIQKIKKIFGSIPHGVVYVPIDLEKGELERKLFESGYDRSLKTLFILEGLTQFISAKAVDEILAFIAKNSGKGSSVIFSYYFQSVVDGTCELEGVKVLKQDLRRADEPLKFGIAEGAIETFLSDRGFYRVKNVTADFLKSTYFKGINQNRNMKLLGGMVNATVKPQE